MRVLFRQTRSNRYTLPLLAHLVENWDQKSILGVEVARSSEELSTSLKQGGPVLVCYSFMTPHLEEVAREVESIRPLLGPRDLLVAGGPHATADPWGTMALGFQTIVCGEAEEVLPSLLEGWIRSPGSVPRILLARGACSLEEALPVSRRLNFMAPLEITRGCPHGCTYCFTPRFHRKPVRHRALVSVARYLEASREMGRSLARFVAPDAFSYRAPEGGDELESLERLLVLCKEMGTEQVHLGDFPSEVRPDRVRPEFLELVLKYCTNKKLVIGAQSGSDRLLSSIKRGHSASEVVRAVQQVVSFGLLAHVDMLFGLPGEESADRLASLRLMERLLRMGRVRIHAHIYLPLPSTPLFHMQPSKVEPWFLEKISQLQGHGSLDGDWETQLLLQEKILHWREKGLIKSY